MSGELDEISRVLGRIEARQTEATRQLEALFKRMDDLRNEQAQTLGVVRTLTHRVDHLERELNDVTPTVEEIKRLKQRGIGMLLVVGLLGAGLAFVIENFINYVTFGS